MPWLTVEDMKELYPDVELHLGKPDENPNVQITRFEWERALFPERAADAMMKAREQKTDPK